MRQNTGAHGRRRAPNGRGFSAEFDVTMPRFGRLAGNVRLAARYYRRLPLSGTGITCLTSSGPNSLLAPKAVASSNNQDNFELWALHFDVCQLCLSYIGG